jgi:hypothetical protein
MYKLGIIEKIISIFCPFVKKMFIINYIINKFIIRRNYEKKTKQQLSINQLQ